MMAQSASYAAAIKAYNPDCRSVYAKVSPGQTLEYVCDEIVSILGEEALAIEKNHLLAPIMLMVQTSGNEFKNENKKSRRAWEPTMS